MSIELSNFTTIVKSKFTIPAEEGVIRVNGASVMISEDVIKPFMTDNEHASVSFQFSKADNALRILKPEDDDGYLVTYKKGPGTKRRYWVMGLPSGFKNMHVARGKYKKLEEQPDIFVLQEESEAYKKLLAEDRYAKYIIEDHKVGPGDIVSWFHKPGVGSDRPTYLATGEVLRFEKEKAVIKPISKNWFDTHSDNNRVQLSRVSLDKLIVREKKNGK